jgi:large subunit ribosomal protein LP2
MLTSRASVPLFLSVLGGNETPDKAAITKILESVGATAEADQIEKVLSELKGKDLDALIAEGSKKLSSVPSGGASSGAAPAAAAGGAAAAAPKAEEKKKSSSESGGGDMGFSLFD